MSAPYEIMTGPLEVWLAPVGETFPDVDATPGGNWTKLGSNGKRNIADDGIVATHEQTIVEHRNVGSTGPIKAVRTEESLNFELTLEDLTASQYAKLLNDVTVTTVAAGSGIPGTKEITLHQGAAVATFAFLAKKNDSPYGDSWSMQYEVPIVYQADNPAPAFKKGDAVGLKCKFAALEDPNAATEAERFGTLIEQDATAT